MSRTTAKAPLAAIAALATLTTLAVPAARAQQYPDKPIRIIVGYTSGATDTAARTFGRPFSTLLNVPVIIENKPGAGGALGAEFVSKAAPDGYTLMWTVDGTHTLNPHLYKTLPYDPLGFTPITKGVSTVNVLVVSTTLNIRNVNELLAYAKANPSKASYGSAGTGSSNHLAGELLQTVTGIPMTHIPYKGSTPALSDLMGGQIGFMFAGVGQMLPVLTAGKIRVIGTADTVRHARLPDVPTMEEAGLKGFDLPAIYHALVGPLKLPAPMVTRLNQAARTALTQPDTVSQLNTQGYDVTPTTADELGALMRKNFDTWGRIVRGAKIEKI